MSSIYYLVFILMLLAGFALYFKLARRYKIVDVPNHRTMHEGATIRGGGIVPFVMIAISVLFIGEPGIYFLLGFVLIGLTGFLDDIINLPGGVRFPLQIIAVLLVLLELQLMSSGIVVMLVILIIATGTLNAFNFMDGLNGMTAGYSAVFVLTMLYVNGAYQKFINSEFLYLVLIAVVVFSLFNFRKRAVCFAGDVGSLSIAFIVVFLVIKLISEAQQFIFILFLTLYGIDTIFTIVQRLYLRQNIFEAHRLHLFQVGVSKTGLSHLQMSGLYMILQLFINVGVIFLAGLSFPNQLIFSAIMLLGISVAYLAVKWKLLKETV